MNAQTLEPVVSTLALQNHALLQALYDGSHKTVAALAAGIGGRDKSNVSKSLKALEEADLAWRPEDAFWTLTVIGIDTLSALGRLAGEPRSLEPAQAAPEGLVTLVWAQIFPDPHNPRRDFDSEEAVEALEELAASIDDVGEVLQNLVVRPLPNAREGRWTSRKSSTAQGQRLPFYQLVAGERRWRAVGLLIQSGRRPETFPHALQDPRPGRRQGQALGPDREPQARRPQADGGGARLQGAGRRRHVHRGDRRRGPRPRAQAALRAAAHPAAGAERGAAGQVDAGTLTIKDALAQLRNRPKPFDFDPSTQLLLLEIADRVHAVGKVNHTFVRLPVHHSAQDPLPGSTLHALSERNLVGIVVGYDDGQTYIETRYGFRDPLQQLTGAEGIDIAAYGPVLRRLRLEAVQANGDDAPGFVVDRLEADDRYLTPFLNPPFDLSPHDVARVTERKTNEAARAADQKAKTAQLEASRKIVRAQVRKIEVAAKKAVTAPLLDGLQAAAEAAGCALPLRVHNDNIEDARGRVVATESYYGHGQLDLGALRRMIVLAVNAASGFAKTKIEDLPAEAEAPDIEEPDEADIEDDDGGEFDEDEEG
jgi:hypothetical protein